LRYAPRPRAHVLSLRSCDICGYMHWPWKCTIYEHNDTTVTDRILILIFHHRRAVFNYTHVLWIDQMILYCYDMHIITPQHSMPKYNKQQQNTHLICRTLELNKIAAVPCYWYHIDRVIIYYFVDNITKCTVTLHFIPIPMYMCICTVCLYVTIILCIISIKRNNKYHVKIDDTGQRYK